MSGGNDASLASLAEALSAAGATSAKAVANEDPSKGPLGVQLHFSLEVDEGADASEVANDLLARAPLPVLEGRPPPSVFALTQEATWQ